MPLSLGYRNKKGRRASSFINSIMRTYSGGRSCDGFPMARWRAKSKYEGNG